MDPEWQATPFDTVQADEEPEEPEVISVEAANAGLSLEQIQAAVNSGLLIRFATREQDGLYAWLMNARAVNRPRLEAAIELARTSGLDVRSAWDRIAFREEQAALQSGFDSAFAALREIYKPMRPMWMDGMERRMRMVHENEIVFTPWVSLQKALFRKAIEFCMNRPHPPSRRGIIADAVRPKEEL